MKRALLVLWGFFVCGSVFAQDRLELKSGQTVEGKVIAQDETSVQIEVAGIPLTYWRDDVALLLIKDSTGPTPSAQEAAPLQETAPLRKEVLSGGLAADWQNVKYEPVPTPPPLEPAAEGTVETRQVEEPVVVPTVDETLVVGWSQEIPEAAAQVASPNASLSPEGVRSALSGRLPTAGSGPRVALPMAVLVLVFFVVLLAYAYFAFCLQLIAQKTQTGNTWFAWVPVLNAILMCDIAGRPRWWTLALVLSFIPFIGGLACATVFTILAWEMCVRRGKPGWIGIGMMLPVLQLAAWGYAAFSE